MTTTITYPNGTVDSSVSALSLAWDIFLAMLDSWSGMPVQFASDFSLDGELTTCSSIGRVRTLSPAQERKAVESCDPNAWFTRGEGMTDTTVTTDDCDVLVPGWEDYDDEGNVVQSAGETVALGRWEHLKDAHYVEQAIIRHAESAPTGNGNPLWSAMVSAKQGRQERFSKVLAWIESAPMAELLKRRNGYAKRQRNESLARELGFSQIPRGQWPGVEWSTEHNAMIRRYRDNGTLVTRIAQLWDVAWTKEQAMEIDQRIEKVVASRLGR